jgi:hypothetical protein
MVLPPEASQYDSMPPVLDGTVDHLVTFHTANVIGHLAIHPTAAVLVGPRGIGKSLITRHVGDVLQDTLHYRVHSIDGNSQSMSPAMIDETREGLLEFDEPEASQASVVIMNHFDNLVRFGGNSDLNDSRAAMLGTLANLASVERAGTLSFLFSVDSQPDSQPPIPQKSVAKFLSTNPAFKSAVVYALPALEKSATTEVLDAPRTAPDVPMFAQPVPMTMVDPASEARTARYVLQLDNLAVQPPGSAGDNRKA